jgi:hypothetical protein
LPEVDLRAEFRGPNGMGRRGWHLIQVFSDGFVPFSGFLLFSRRNIGAGQFCRFDQPLLNCLCRRRFTALKMIGQYEKLAACAMTGFLRSASQSSFA